MVLHVSTWKNMARFHYRVYITYMANLTNFLFIAVFIKFPNESSDSPPKANAIRITQNIQHVMMAHMAPHCFVGVFNKSSTHLYVPGCTTHGSVCGLGAGLLI
jgi:hypothetical protein